MRIVILIKYNSSGSPQWITHFVSKGKTAAYGYPALVTKAPNNQLYYVGTFADTLVAGNIKLYNPGTNVSFLATVNADGQITSAKKFGSSRHEFTGMESDIEGNIYLTGFSMETATIDFGNGVMFTGTGNFIVKLNADLVGQWVKPLPELGVLGDVNLAISKNYIALCSRTGNSSRFLSANLLNLNGTILWTKTTSGSGSSSSIGQTVTVDDNGNVVVGGNGKGTTLDFGEVILTPTSSSRTYNIVACFDNTGKTKWAKLLSQPSGSNNNAGMRCSVQYTSGGNVVATGGYSFPLQTDNCSLPAIGFNEDRLFIASFSANGSCLSLVSNNLVAENNNYGQAARGSLVSGNTLMLIGEFRDKGKFGNQQLTNTGASFGYSHFISSLSIGSSNGISLSNPNSKTCLIYPNPAENVLNILTTERIKSVEIMDITGKVALRSSSSSINIENLTPGIYNALITTTSGTENHRFTK